MLYKLKRCTVDINKSVCKNYLEITKIERVRKKRMERKKGKKPPVRNQPAIVHQSPQAVFLENLNLIPQPSPPPPPLPPQGGKTVVQDSPPPSNNYDTNLDTVKKNVCGRNPVGWRTRHRQENRLAAHHHHHHHYRREERLSCKIRHHHHHHPTTTTTTMSGGQYFD